MIIDSKLQSKLYKLQKLVGDASTGLVNDVNKPQIIKNKDIKLCFLLHFAFYFA